MAQKSLQKHAGAAGAVIAFLLVFGFCVSSAQAAFKITVDGLVRGTTLETSRTIQAAAEAFYLIFGGPCSMSEVTIGDNWVRSSFYYSTYICDRIVYRDGSWLKRRCHDVCWDESGTWDVVCEQDSDCDDGLTCNGAETCIDTACVAGSPPCSEAQVCDEDNDRCVECLGNADCDAGHFCLGGECRFAGLVKDTGDLNERVCNPPSYTDLGNGIVRDNTTGLDWVQDGNVMATRDPSFDFDGTAGDGAVGRQTALDYIDLLNDEEYRGYSDWRLPTVKELYTLVDAGRENPSIDPVFLNMVAAEYWTSTKFQVLPMYSYIVDFSNRTVNNDTGLSYVLAVREGPHAVSDSFFVNGDGTVTDTNTGLMWHRCTHWQVWDDDTAACIGNPEPPDWRQPFAYIEELNTASYLGYRDWRLPTVNELLSQIDYSLDSPASTFPGVGSADTYITSTNYFSDRDSLKVSFGFGAVVYWSDTGDYIRAVRGGSCELTVDDDPPVLGDGPFLAAGTWPVLPTSQESPMYLDQSYSVLWTFSDDFASCSGDCTHVAEYQAVGGDIWTEIPVTVNIAKGNARVTLPVESLQNATTYAFRFSVTDCASQTTQSAVYYFRVAITDAPPIIGDGPFLAAGSWPVLPTSAAGAFVLDQNYNVLWTFSDDYAYCSGLCTHRARYKRIGGTDWTWLSVGTNPGGDWYAYIRLPVEGMAPGDYMFHFDVRDCAGQFTLSPRYYYFKVE